MIGQPDPSDVVSRGNIDDRDAKSASGRGGVHGNTIVRHTGWFNKRRLAGGGVLIAGVLTAWSLIGHDVGSDAGDVGLPPSPPADESAPGRSPVVTTGPSTVENLPGPPFGTALPAQLVAVDQAGNTVTVDLTTGERTEPVGGPHLGSEVLGVSGGYVRANADQQLFWPSDQGSPVPLGRAHRALSAGGPDQVWLITHSGEGVSTGTLVDLTGSELATVVVPSHEVVAGTATGVTFSRGGAVFHSSRDEMVHLGRGSVVSANAEQVIALDCLTEICELVALPTDGSRPVHRGRLPVTFEGPWTSATSPEGDIALHGAVDGQRVLELFLADGTRTQVPVPWTATSMIWLPNGHGLVVASTTATVRVDPRTGQSSVIPGFGDHTPQLSLAISSAVPPRPDMGG